MLAAENIANEPDASGFACTNTQLESQNATDQSMEATVTDSDGEIDVALERFCGNITVDERGKK